MSTNESYLPWWQKTPLTKEQMQSEIESSRIVDKRSEFSDEDIHETLKALNLTDKYTNDRPASAK